MSSSKYKTPIYLGIKSSMRWSELKQDIMVWSSLKHMLWSVFWKSDSKIIGFSKLFMAKSALKLNLSYIEIRYILTDKRHWYLNFYLPHWQIQQTVFHLTRLLFSKTQFMQQSILNATDLRARAFQIKPSFASSPVVTWLFHLNLGAFVLLTLWRACFYTLSLPSSAVYLCTQYLTPSEAKS